MARLVGGRIGDPTRETVGQPVPINLADLSSVFIRCADRRELLAADHPMPGWLRFMARLARVQHDAVLALPVADAVAVIEGEPPLAFDAHRRDPDWHAALDIVLRHVDDQGLPEQARSAMRQLRKRDAAARDALADLYLRGDVPREQTGEAGYLAHRAGCVAGVGYPSVATAGALSGMRVSAGGGRDHRSRPGARRVLSALRPLRGDDGGTKEAMTLHQVS